jgi:hypothetical protein
MVIGRGSQHLLELSLRRNHPGMLMNWLDLKRISVRCVERPSQEILALFDGDHRLQQRKRALRGARGEAIGPEELPGEEKIRRALDPCRELLEGSADGGLILRSEASRRHSIRFGRSISAPDLVGNDGAAGPVP